MAETTQPATPVEPPRGTYPARVDEKGRLKLPVAFQEYLTGIGETKVFATTTDLSTARLYPISAWKNNEKLLAELTDGDLEAAQSMALITNHFGADTEVDSQGRLLVHTELRRELNIENQPVYLQWYREGIVVYSKDVYDAKLKNAMSNLPDKLKQLERKGFK